MTTLAPTPDQQLLLDAESRHGYDPWYHAILLAAIQETKDARKAVIVAEYIHKRKPKDTSTEAGNDAEKLFVNNPDKELSVAEPQPQIVFSPTTTIDISPLADVMREFAEKISARPADNGVADRLDKIETKIDDIADKKETKGEWNKLVIKHTDGTESEIVKEG